MENSEEKCQEPMVQYMNVMCEFDKITNVHDYLASRPKSVPRPTISRQISTRVKRSASNVGRPISIFFDRIGNQGAVIGTAIGNRIALWFRR